ncbi:MAG: polyprenol monophosphomannose synthase [Armatimonadota bacterium]
MNDYTDAYATIATYNECENLPRVLPLIGENAPGLNLIIIDDGSPDGTGEIADAFAKDHPWVTVIHRQGKGGYASAHIAGLRVAIDRGARRLLTMDADLSHDPSVLPAILKGLEEYDMVLGSRYVAGGGTRNWGLLRRLLSRFGSFYARSILGVRQNDCTTGYRGYRTALVLKSGMLETKTQGYGFLVEVLYRCVRAGAKVLEVPIVFNDRQYGKSKLSKAIMLEAMLLPWRLRFGKKGR